MMNEKERLEWAELLLPSERGNTETSPAAFSPGLNSVEAKKANSWFILNVGGLIRS